VHLWFTCARQVADGITTSWWLLLWIATHNKDSENKMGGCRQDLRNWLISNVGHQTSGDKLKVLPIECASKCHQWKKQSDNILNQSCLQMSLTEASAKFRWQNRTLEIWWMHCLLQIQKHVLLNNSHETKWKTGVVSMCCSQFELMFGACDKEAMADNVGKALRVSWATYHNYHIPYSTLVVGVIVIWFWG